MADLPVRPWHTLLARSLLRSALATPFVSCTIGGTEGNDGRHGNNAVQDKKSWIEHRARCHSRTQTAGATRSQFPFSTILTVEGLL